MALARGARLIFSAQVGRMMCNRVCGLHVGLRSGIFAGAILVAVGVTPVHAQSSAPIAPPANTVGPADSTPSADHVRKPTEPPAFDPNKPAARAARVKATPPAASPRPAAPNPPSAGAAQPRRPATTIDPFAEPAKPPGPSSRPAARQQWIDPFAEPATASAAESRSTTRRRAEPAKVVGVDSLGRSSEDPSPEPSPAARSGERQ
jgi:hypothetical protein